MKEINREKRTFKKGAELQCNLWDGVKLFQEERANFGARKNIYRNNS